MEEDEESTSWVNNYDSIVSDYPFYSIPIGILRNPQRWPMEEKQLRSLIAFKALRARPSDLQLASKFLFPND